MKLFIVTIGFHKRGMSDIKSAVIANNLGEAVYKAVGFYGIDTMDRSDWYWSATEATDDVMIIH